MSTSSMSTSTAPGPTDPSTTGTTNDEGSTTDQAKHAASVASDEAKQVASDVRDQARGLLDETKNQVQDQSRTQRDRLVETLRTFGDDLDGMAQDGNGLASGAAREVAQRVRTISERLDGREPSELLEDLRSFARRRPGMFLAGAVISGVVVGRLLRGGRDAAQAETSRAETDIGATQSQAFAPVTPARPSQPFDASLDETLGSPADRLAGARATRRDPVMTAYDASSGVPLEEPRDGRTLGQIVGDISQDLTTLVRQEMDLAKTELRQEAQQAGKGIGMLAGAAVTALLMLIFLSWALTWLLDNWMPVELAALITALIWAVVTGVLASMGRTKLREANPQLPQTQQTLKEDAAWVRAQKS